MYAGRIVESGPVDEVFARPGHGYTVGLMGCTPRIDRDIGRLTPIEGLPPSLTAPPVLCPFLPRCAVSVAACREVMPPMRPVTPGHEAACHADLRHLWKRPAA
jgi:oligopeptide/dipeptide ABC transporter ATP-binding protein